MEGLIPIDQTLVKQSAVIYRKKFSRLVTPSIILLHRQIW